MTESGPVGRLFVSAARGAEDQRSALAAVVAGGTVTVEHLWMRYFALGGAADAFEVEGYLQGLMPLAPGQRDVLAHAANEAIDEAVGRSRVPYSRLLRSPAPVQGPLAALVGLLEAAPKALTGGLAPVAAAAGGALGVEVVVYLVDYEQNSLVPVPAADGQREPLPIEGTMAGRAFETGLIQPALSDPQARIWVPVLDGVERLGVLDVMVPSAVEASDVLLQEQCAWLSSLLAHLISGAANHGDQIDEVRSTRRRSPSAELVWGLLPPLAAGSEQFSVAALLEPAYDVGGDAFDYALGPDQVSLAIFDGMGHGLRAGLIAATALSAHRAARRAGDDLPTQARALDEAIAAQFPDAFATGVLAELDLGTGRLRYILAGHPPPLIIRHGKVVAALQHGLREPFGLGTGEAAVAETSLQPGDWLVLHTDGLTEARDDGGRFFGTERLIDFLQRESAADLPPAETARRLIRAVLRHQDGVLQDDATIVLARWAPPPSTPPPTQPAPRA